MPRVCAATDCTDPPAGTRGLGARYCPSHLKRLSTYGSVDDWDPIPFEQNHPADPVKVAMLRDLHLHDRLGAWCEARLNTQTPAYVRRMSDRVLYGLLRRYWPR